MKTKLFRDLEIGAIFVFAAEKRLTSMAQGPWVKLSARKYARHDSWQWMHKVASVKEEVEGVQSREDGRHEEIKE